MLMLPALSCLGYSSGGGEGGAGQTCDAISLCDQLWDGAATASCPSGMTKVAPPERSQVYTVSSPTSAYTGGGLLEIHVRVTAPQIQAKRNAGVLQCNCDIDADEDCSLGYTPCDSTFTEPHLESSKYIGLLMYAVREGDSTEVKVGSWELPAEVPPMFHTPVDAGCASRALMHANANAKSFFHRFHFRAPPAGTGTLVFRALFKQGDTNGGAFYWAAAASGASAGSSTPAAGVSGGDLTIRESASPPPPQHWFTGAPFESCAEACAKMGMACDEPAMAEAARSAVLASDIARHHVCQRPLIASCGAAVPATTNLPDAFCWAWPVGGEASCPAGEDSGAAACDTRLTESDRLRLCACGGDDGRRRLASHFSSEEVAGAVSAPHPVRPGATPCPHATVAARAAHAAQPDAPKLGVGGGGGGGRGGVHAAPLSVASRSSIGGDGDTPRTATVIELLGALATFAFSAAAADGRVRAGRLPRRHPVLRRHLQARAGRDVRAGARVGPLLVAAPGRPVCAGGGAVRHRAPLLALQERQPRRLRTGGSRQRGTQRRWCQGGRVH